MKAKREIAAITLAGAVVAGGYALEHGQDTATPKPAVSHSAAPNVSTDMPSVKPKHETHEDKVADIESQMQDAQTGLKAVNAAKLREFVKIVNEKGYTDTDKYMHGARRLVVYGNDGTQYTDELDYAKSYGSKDNTLKSITIYVQRPGESQAEHVTIDGVDAVGGMGGVRFPIDGVVDQPLGYDHITNRQIKRDIHKYGALSGGVEAVRSTQEGGEAAQQDYLNGVNVTLQKEG